MEKLSLSLWSDNSIHLKTLLLQRWKLKPVIKTHNRSVPENAQQSITYDSAGPSKHTHDGRIITVSSFIFIIFSVQTNDRVAKHYIILI